MWNKRNGALLPWVMRTPMQFWNPWLALASQAAIVGWEAQQVIALRLMRIAAGGSRGRDEAQRMVSEKVAAFAEAQAIVTASAAGGGTSRGAGKKVLNVYGKRIRANRRRLSQ
jgi:hypothetical protein